jgi:pimeloyl-ACP methyl ester carboxylesterase
VATETVHAGSANVTTLHDRLAVGDVHLESWRLGTGEPVLLLHDIEYVNEPRPFMELLANTYSVISPSHPGFGASDLPESFDSVDDLAYLYLDLLRDIGGAHVIGMGFGGWIAAEMAVRSTGDIRSLVLAGAVGIKASGRETAEIADTFVMDPRRFLEIAWHDPVLAEDHMSLPGLGALTESDLVKLFRNRQAAALYGWNPFMHNPKLLGRLHRVAVPTLVIWGESDGIVDLDYGQAFARAIPAARMETLEAAGHYPYLERPERFVELVSRYFREQR